MCIRDSNVSQEEFNDQSCQVITREARRDLKLTKCSLSFLATYIVFFDAPILFRLLFVLWLQGV